MKTINLVKHIITGIGCLTSFLYVSIRIHATVYITNELFKGLAFNVLATTQSDLTELTRLSSEEIGFTIFVRSLTFTVASFIGKLMQLICFSN